MQANSPSPLEAIALVIGVFLFQIIARLLLLPMFTAVLGPISTIIVVQLVIILGPTIAFLLGGRFDIARSLPLAPPRARGVLSGLCLGLSLWIPAYLTAFLVGRLLGETAVQDVSNEITKAVQAADASLGVLGTLFVFAMLPGFTEELLVRGVMLPAFLRRWPRWLAIIGSGFLFGVLHGNLPQAIVMTVVGAVLGFTVARSGSLWISMLAHMVHNSLILIVSMQPNLTDPEKAPSWLGGLLLSPILLLVGLWSLPKAPPEDAQ